MEAVAEHELSVVLSSHVVSDLERVCDYLVVLVDSQVRVAGDVDELLATHHRLDRAAPRPGHAAGRPARRRGQPHRPADHARRPHRRADPRPGLDGRAGSAWRTSCSPTWTTAGGVRPPRRPAGGRSDDLADLAPVPRCRPRSRRRGRRGRRVVLARHRPAAGRPRPAAARASSTGSRAPTATCSTPGIVVMAVGPAAHRRLLGRAAGRPRAGGRHPPAGLEPVRHPHAAGWRPSSASPRGRRRRRRRGSAWRSPGGPAPLDGAVSQTRGGLPDRLTPVAFAMRGVVPVGYAVFAVVLGVTVGAVLRRTLPAMARDTRAVRRVRSSSRCGSGPTSCRRSPDRPFSRATLDGISLDGTGPRLGVGAHRRPRGLGRWSNETVGPDGQAAPLPQWFADCLPGPPAAAGPGAADARAGRLDRRLPHPAHAGAGTGNGWSTSRRTGSGRCSGRRPACTLLASAALAAGCFWWVRRRLT